MRRRDLLSLIGGAAALVPIDTGAQQKAMPVIGFLGNGSPSFYGPLYLAAFQQALSDAGYVGGKTWKSNIAGQIAASIGSLHWPPISSAAVST